MTSIYAIGILGSVGSLLTAILYQGITEGNHKPWDIVSTRRYIPSAASEFTPVLEGFMILDL
jgi:hypothetical protein